MNTTRTRSPVLLLLIAGDLLCFLFFALSGLNSHHEALSLHNLARAAGTFSGSWLVVAYLFLPRAMPGQGSERLSAVAIAWPPAWAVGFGLRLLFFHRSFEPAFALISFLVLGLMLAAWRLGLRWLARRSG